MSNEWGARATHYSSLITHHLRLACGVHPTRRATRRPSIVKMRCCSFFLFLVVVAGAFVAGLLLRDVPVTDAKIGGIPLPAGMRRQIESELQAQVDQVMAQQHVQVRAVAVGDGKLIATGTAN